MLNFPYPVLDENGSGYKSGISFSIDETEHLFDHGQLKIKIKLDLSSQYLKDLIINGKAEIVFKFTSDIHTNIYKFETIKPVYTIKHSTNKLLSIDTLHIVASIINTEPLTISYNDEFMEFFGKDYNFEAPAHIRLAVSNEVKLNYLLKNPDFIRITKRDDMDDNGISFSCQDSQYIRIFVGEKFNNAYATNKELEEVKSLTNIILVSNALIYTIVQLAKDGVDEYSDYEWYKALSQSSAFDELSIDDFISEMNEDLQIDEIFKIVQVIMNNAIEKTIINISDRR